MAPATQPLCNRRADRPCRRELHRRAQEKRLDYRDFLSWFSALANDSIDEKLKLLFKAPR